MKESELAGLFNSIMLKSFKNVDAELIWQTAKKLAAYTQPRKSYQDLYNSPESRQERKRLIKTIHRK